MYYTFALLAAHLAGNQSSNACLGTTADFPMKKEASFENWIGQAENNSPLLIPIPWFQPMIAASCPYLQVLGSLPQTCN